MLRGFKVHCTVRRRSHNSYILESALIMLLQQCAPKETLLGFISEEVIKVFVSTPFVIRNNILVNGYSVFSFADVETLLFVLF